MIKKLLLVLIIILSIGVVFWGLKKSFFNKSGGLGEYSWVITQDGSKAYVYLTGNGSENVSAAEIKLDFDQTKLKLTEVKSGGYFQNPLLIKWDNTTGSFSLIENPEKNLKSNPDLPILIIDLGVSKNTKLGIDPESQIYVREVGGFNPKVSLIDIIK